MSSLFCCVSRGRSSPDLPNVKLVSSVEDKPQGILPRPNLHRSIATNESTFSEDAHELDMIFASSQDQSPQASLHKRRVYNTDLTDPKRHSRSSTSRLQEVLRKRLSRDSIFSAKSSRRKSKISLSEEDVERRKELKRALHQRLRDELLADRTASQGGYDVDAEIITTPKVTKSRSGGAIKMSPKELSDLMRRLNTASSNHDLHDSYGISPNVLDIDAKIPASYEHTNASKVTSIWEDDIPDSETPPQYAINEIKQIFMAPRKGSVEIVEIVRRSTDASPTPPMNGSDTIVQSPKARLVYTGQRSTASVPGVIEVPLSPDLLPLRMPSITESVQGDWRLSFAGSRKGSAPSRSYPANGGLSCTTVPKSNRPSYPKGWRPEKFLVSDARARFHATDSGGSGDTDGILSSAGHAHKCDPSSEEQDFGGVDGENAKEKLRKARKPSEDLGKETRARKRYSIESEPQTGSPRKILTTAVSLPQLRNKTRHGRSRSSGTYSTAYSLREQRPRYSSSSGYVVPLNDRSVYPDTASSVYTYAGGSAMPSPGSSVTRFGNLSDKLKLLDPPSDYRGLPFYGCNSSLNVSSTALPKDLHDRNSSRRRTIDTTSFQSSTASFRAQELAAAATRIVPKPRTLTKARTSRFKEELGEESVKVKSLGRKSMLGRGFSKKGNFRSYDGSEEWYSTGKRQGYGFAFVAEEPAAAAAMWERALRDHAEEIAASPPKRPGSLSHVFARRSLRGKASSSKLKTRPAISRDNSRLNVSQSGKLGHLTPAIIVTPVKAASRAQKHPSSPSWGKFPSHNRALRSESPANEADNVHSHDFASAALRPNDSPQSRRSFLGKRKKSRSMTFSRHMFHSWSRLYKSHSSGNVKAQARGIRSSVSGSSVPSPYTREGLALAALTAQPTVEEDVAKVLFPMSEAGESTIAEEREGGDVYLTKRSAKAWSRLYEECVKVPRDTDTEAGSVMEGKGAGLRLGGAMERGTTVSVTGKELSEVEGTDMRASTVEFQRELEAHEEEERRKVLEATERFGEA
ncbi:hypothetical protein MMC34_006473 [Xylographa carneopallida]|nr:hypothetical protein [Xylographa carneopallida]